MEERKLFAADLGFDLTAPAPDTQAAVQVSFRSDAIDLAMDGYEEGSERSDDKEWHDTKPMGWDNTVHKKWSDGGIRVDREMTESGEKGSTEDINIGVGELQECTISKSMDTASMSLAQFAINGNSLGTAEIDFVDVGGGGDAVPSADDGLQGLLLPAVQQAHADAPGHNVGLMSTGGDLEVGFVRAGLHTASTNEQGDRATPVEDLAVRRYSDVTAAAVDSMFANDDRRMTENVPSATVDNCVPLGKILILDENGGADSPSVGDVVPTTIEASYDAINRLVSTIDGPIEGIETSLNLRYVHPADEG